MKQANPRSPGGSAAVAVASQQATAKQTTTDLQAEREALQRSLAQSRVQHLDATKRGDRAEMSRLMSEGRRLVDEIQNLDALVGVAHEREVIAAAHEQVRTYDRACHVFREHASDAREIAEAIDRAVDTVLELYANAVTELNTWGPIVRLAPARANLDSIARPDALRLAIERRLIAAGILRNPGFATRELQGRVADALEWTDRLLRSAERYRPVPPAVAADDNDAA